MALMVGEIKGLEATLRRFSKLGEAGQKAADKVMAQTANEVRNTAIKSINAHGSKGAVYEKENPKRTHTASAPHNPPNTDTGRLTGSIKVVRKGRAFIVGTSLPYGYYLEFGTRKIIERPWLRPAVKLAIKDMPKKLAEAFAKIKNDAGFE